jgi:hypothetical protein
MTDSKTRELLQSLQAKPLGPPRQSMRARPRRAGERLTEQIIETAAPGRHCDGNGLWLAVSPSGTKKWVFRFSWHGKPTEMGLGSLRIVGLAEARLNAGRARELLSHGINPLHAGRYFEGRRDA